MAETVSRSRKLNSVKREKVLSYGNICTCRMIDMDVLRRTSCWKRTYILFEGRKEETRHIHSDTASNLVSMSLGPLSSLLSDEYHLQTKSKQRSLQDFVEEVQIVNADF